MLPNNLVWLNLLDYKLEQSIYSLHKRHQRKEWLSQKVSAEKLIKWGILYSHRWKKYLNFTDSKVSRYKILYLISIVSRQMLLAISVQDRVKQCFKPLKIFNKLQLYLKRMKAKFMTTKCLKLRTYINSTSSNQKHPFK